MSAEKIIDYLPEDNSITGQRYALVSIVGPLMPQKCDVWAIKIRGVADTVEQAKALSRKIMNYDKDFDIFTAEVGKFFPLAVEPLQVEDVEYQNEQLNTLMKGYLQNREQANEQWHERKNEMVKSARQQGSSSSKPVEKEHATAVLQKMQERQEQIEKLTSELEATKNVFASNEYTDTERLDAYNVLKSEKPSFNGSSPRASELTLPTKIEECLEELKNLDLELETEKDENKRNLLNEKKKTFQEKLKGKSTNDYINNQYQGSEYSYLQDNVATSSFKS